MTTKKPAMGRSGHKKNDAAHLLEALEALRAEVGSVGEEIITLMREAGISPSDDPEPLGSPTED